MLRPPAVLAVLVAALLIVVGITPVPAAAAGPPAVEWQRCLGGTDQWSWVDEASAVQQATDGGYIVAGSTQSTDGDVWGNHGGTDAWVVKLNPAGGIEWQRCLGGTGTDRATDVQQTLDGGYIVAGSTASTDGDVAGIHGGTDAWVVKMNPAGGIEWQRCLGGTRGDWANAVQQTADGGYILAGMTESNDGDVVGYYGPHPYGSFYPDLWVVKLDPGGVPAWQSCLGGSNGEAAYDLCQTQDGGYIVVGVASSIDGEIGGGNPSSYDDAEFLVVKLDAVGTLEWYECLGGADDDIGYGVDQTPDGGFIVAGTVRSPWGSGDVWGNHGSADAWVVRLNATGRLTWQRCLGGTEYDGADHVRQTADGGYIVAGRTASTDGDVTGAHGGGSDAWVAKLNATGGLTWQRCLGGTEYDSTGSVQPTTDGGYIVAGKTNSNDGDVSGLHVNPYGYGDAWVVKLDAGISVAMVPGGAGLPTDPDADGTYDDVNGNNRPDFADVVLYFNQMAWIAANEPVSAFDYNGNGRIDFADVVWLFNAL